jgi:O-acetyl-ADP-ribose deacetylase (regulator of RNase III)
VPDSAAAVRLAAELEDRVAGVYSDLVRAAGGGRRVLAAEALREAAVRAVRWRGESVAFPGLAERAGTAPPAAAPTA